MNCLDCAIGGRAVAAVAVCHTCGAAVCPDHAAVRPHHLTRTAPINQTVLVEPAARIVRCSTCDAAHEAATRSDAG